jgi:ubiquinone/menaquinone biosynthesis C-methylase UbiE
MYNHFLETHKTIRFRTDDAMKKDPYRVTSRRYDKRYEPINRGLRLIGLKMFLPKEGMSILDVGCGTGSHLEIYQRYPCDLFGIYPSPSMLEIARAKLEDRVDLRLGNASELPYEDTSFDLVIAMLTLHEMRPATRFDVINEMKRVLKDNGRLLWIDFHPGPIRSIKGWMTKGIIFFSEVIASREHFRNYRHFMAIKGLPALIQEHSLVIEKQKIVGSGAMALFLLRKG